ncbi:MAG: hypothetical protein HFE04_02960 [Bacilli bacterium]|nr:hypothetical protein [Bacilli bacterium]
MPKIKIAHLYYDLMNLYGENGNVRALKRFIERQDIKCDIHFLSIGDSIDFQAYDLFYIGMGSEHSELLVLDDIKKYRDDIKKAIDKGKHFLITGNAMELFGSHIVVDNKKSIKALDIFPYYTVHESIRVVGSAVFKTRLIKDKIIGFQNRAGIIYGIDKPLFKVIDGTGSIPNATKEGYIYKNFYATYLLGPFYIRNPYFTSFIVKNVMKQKNKKYKLKMLNRTTEIKAYNEYLNNFHIN